MRRRSGRKVRKPSSVPAGDVAVPAVAVIHLGRASPRASSDVTRELGRATLERSSIPSCTRWGLPCDRRYRRPGELLPHPFTLTAEGRSRPRRFAFCGTVLGVTPTRRYLASCPVVLGLSSRGTLYEPRRRSPEPFRRSHHGAATGRWQTRKLVEPAALGSVPGCGKA